jgi:hypothetical protein
LALTGLLIVTPPPEDTNCPLLPEDLVHQPVLDVDAAQVRSIKITDKLLERRGIPKRVLRHDLEKNLRLLLQPGRRQLLRVLGRMLAMPFMARRDEPQEALTPIIRPAACKPLERWARLPTMRNP